MCAANRAAIAFAVALAACGRGGANYSPTDPARGFAGDTVPPDDAGTADAGQPDGGPADAGAQSCAFPPSSLLALDGCAGGVAPGVPQPAARAGAKPAAARPQNIFADDSRPVEAPHDDLPTLFAEELISEKSLDEVILAFLSADLEPPK